MDAVRKDMPGITIDEERGGADFGQVVYPPGGRLGPRLQPCVQLVSIERGLATIERTGDGHVWTVGERQTILLLPGEELHFRFAADAPTHHLYVHLWDMPQNNIDLHALPRVIETADPLRILFELGLATTNVRFAHRLAEALLTGYVEHACTGLDRRRQHPPPVTRAVTLVDDHLGETLTLDDLADAAGVTANHLIRLFKQSFGQTPVRWLWSRRVEAGLRMLRDTGLSVSEIAAACGFQSAFHFSRRVREQVGLSPTEIRQRSWQRDRG